MANDAPQRLGRLFDPEAIRRAVTASGGTPPPAEPTNALCQHCNGAKYGTPHVPRDHPMFGRLIRCPHCNAQADTRRDLLALTEASLGDEAGLTLDSFNLRRRLYDFEYEGKTVNLAQQSRALQRAYTDVSALIAKPEHWLFMYGPPGSGKTHLAIAAYNAVSSQLPAAFVRVAAMLGYLRDGIDDHTVDARLEQLKTIGFLILDDLGTERPTEWGLARLYDIIDARYAARRPTLITSNIPLLRLIPERPRQDEELHWQRILSRIGQCLAKQTALIVADYRMLHLLGEG
jgi:DNA replication protein DnaC